MLKPFALGVAVWCMCMCAFVFWGRVNATQADEAQEGEFSRVNLLINSKLVRFHFLLHANDLSLKDLIFGVYETELTKTFIAVASWFRVKRLLDVGSNYGHYTMVAASMGIFVEGYDIQPNMVRALQLTCSTSALPCKVHHRVFGSTDKTIEIFNLAKMGYWQGASVMHEPACTEASCSKLTVVGEPNLNLIHGFDMLKIDVDGFESNFICKMIGFKGPWLIELTLNPGWINHSVNVDLSFKCLFELFHSTQSFYLIAEGAALHDAGATKKVNLNGTELYKIVDSSILAKGYKSRSGFNVLNIFIF